MSALVSFDRGLFSTAEEIDRITSAINLLFELELAGALDRYGFRRASDGLKHLRSMLEDRLEDENWDGGQL